MTTLTSGPPAATTGTERQLAVAAPHLLDGFRAALPHAAEVVGRRLLGALYREDLAREQLAGRGVRHAFDRMEFAAAGTEDPTRLLPVGAAPLVAELGNAVVNLALAYARRPG